MEGHEIQMPGDPKDLFQHEPIDVIVTVRTRHGDERPVLLGRCTTRHVRPNGAIVEVRPQLSLPMPLKRGDSVQLRLKRGAVPLEPTATAEWIRPRAFLPSGLAVSLIGFTFDWDPNEMALEVAAFLA